MTGAINFGRLGAHIESGETTFRVYSSIASAVELCLFDSRSKQTSQQPLQHEADGVWSTQIKGRLVGQRYGYRVHGPYRPEMGERCNPAKLLIDPYARQLDGYVEWHPAQAGFADGDPFSATPCNRDSATFVPKSMVVADHPPVTRQALRNWQDSIVYEMNVRGFTMRWPELDDAERGRFAGLSNQQVLSYLKSLGVTTVELMPVQTFMDEQFLAERGLRNFWGYNTVNFFAPMARYGGPNILSEFRAMTAAIHDAGLEVVLDVVYNHTAETDEYGPTLSLRGFDNAAYYRLNQAQPGRYINDTGCGNTLNADAAIVQKLILDSLTYWANNMGVDGFRFDLAPILGRHRNGFNPHHPLLQAIAAHPGLAAARLIAEPWDPGPGGYQLGQFGPRWAEWNDKYRDSVRRFWRGDQGASGDFASAVHGSADRFADKVPEAHGSINFVTSHDGFTLNDLVSYNKRHNAANLQDNRDGHAHNYSSNCGCEGPSADPKITALRRRQRLNHLATLLVSRGVPMVLAGDEIGHSQKGNNNAYAQDNELTWLNWKSLDNDPTFLAEVRDWIALRHAEPLLRKTTYPHGDLTLAGLPDIAWLTPAGEPMPDTAWSDALAFAMLLTSAASKFQFECLAMAVNRAPEQVTIDLPAHDQAWRLLNATGQASVNGTAVTLEGFSMAVLKRQVD